MIMAGPPRRLLDQDVISGLEKKTAALEPIRADRPGKIVTSRIRMSTVAESQDPTRLDRSGFYSTGDHNTIEIAKLLKLLA